jgi:two-component system chemotaxis sensor kinase CheA
MSDADAELLQVFRDEVEERLDRFVDELLAIERGELRPEAVDALFREVHTIKGGAGMLGLDEVRELAHAAEDILASVREEGSFPPELVAPLLRVADALRRNVDGKPAATAGLVEELAALSPGTTAAPAQENGSGGAAELLAQAAAPRQASQSEHRSVRVPAEKIDRLLDLVGETVLHQRRLEHELAPAQREADRTESLTDELDAGARLVDELKSAAIEMRTRPLSSIVGPLPRAVRDLAAEHGKEVELVITGAETELDRVILESLADPLTHVLRNAVAHGIEPPDEREAVGKPRCGRLELRAVQRGPLVEVTVEDDGRGVSAEVLAEAKRLGSLVDVLARPGYSTAGEVTDLAGRGVGLDAVKAHTETFGGSLDARSEPGQGTEIVLLLPLALALVNVLLVVREGTVYGIPLVAIDEVLACEKPLSLIGRHALDLRGQPIPLEDLADLVGAAAAPLGEGAPAVVVASGGRKIAVACDRLLGEEEVLLGHLSPLLDSVKGYLGTAILGDGTIALMLDPALLRRGSPERVQRRPVTPPVTPQTPKVLVVEDSFTVRELQRSILESAGYRVETAGDGREALERVAENGIDLVLTDIEMPELDGLQLTRAIRSDAEHASLPIVIVSSRGSDDDRQAGIEAGADAYMIKRGFDQQALLETVERLVGR